MVALVGTPGTGSFVGDKEKAGDSECHIKVADEFDRYHLAAQVDEGASNSVLEDCPDVKTGHEEKHFFAGSCAAMFNKTAKDENLVLKAIIDLGDLLKNFKQWTYPKGCPSDPHMDRNDNVCAVCKQRCERALIAERCSHPPSLGTPVHMMFPSGSLALSSCVSEEKRLNLVSTQ
nr:uncharacterized protein LOC109173545 isoform X1 [Ipomoea batatas]